jgi:hypothetical protein
MKQRGKNYNNENNDFFEEKRKANGGNVEEMEKNYLVNIYVFRSVITIKCHRLFRFRLCRLVINLIMVVY